jgi:hypothetical protein
VRRSWEPTRLSQVAVSWARELPVTEDRRHWKWVFGLRRRRSYIIHRVYARGSWPASLSSTRLFSLSLSLSTHPPSPFSFVFLFVCFPVAVSLPKISPLYSYIVVSSQSSLVLFFSVACLPVRGPESSPLRVSAHPGQSVRDHMLGLGCAPPT